VNATAKQQLRRNVDNQNLSNPTKIYSVPATENPDGTLNIPSQAVFGIDPNHEPIDMYLAVRTVPGGDIVSANDGGNIGATGRSIAVPAGFKYSVQMLTTDTTMTATVGNRVLVGYVYDNLGSLRWVGSASANVTAAQVGGYDIMFGAGGAPSTTVRRNLANTGNTNIQVRENCPISELGPGWYITIADVAAIDAADQLIMRLSVRRVPV